MRFKRNKLTIKEKTYWTLGLLTLLLVRMVPHEKFRTPEDKRRLLWMPPEHVSFAAEIVKEHFAQSGAPSSFKEIQELAQRISESFEYKRYGVKVAYRAIYAHLLESDIERAADLYPEMTNALFQGGFNGDSLRPFPHELSDLEKTASALASEGLADKNIVLYRKLFVHANSILRQIPNQKPSKELWEAINAYAPAVRALPSEPTPEKRTEYLEKARQIFAGRDKDFQFNWDLRKKPVEALGELETEIADGGGIDVRSALFAVLIEKGYFSEAKAYGSHYNQGCFTDLKALEDALKAGRIGKQHEAEARNYAKQLRSELTARLQSLKKVLTEKTAQKPRARHSQ